MAKPSTLPEWATDAGALVTEPSLAKKQEGWAVNDIPPPHFQNWYQRVVYNWTQYLNDLHNETDFLNKSYAWVGTHTFAQSALYSLQVTGAAIDIDTITSGDVQINSAAAANLSAATNLTLDATAGLLDVNCATGFDLDVTGAGAIALTAANGVLDVDVVGGLSLVSTGAGNSEINAGSNTLSLTADDIDLLATTRFGTDVPIDPANNFVFSAVRTRTVELNLGKAFVKGSWGRVSTGGGAGGSNEFWVEWDCPPDSDGDSILFIPIVLPPGSTIKNYDIMVSQTGTDPGGPSSRLRANLCRYQPRYYDDVSTNLGPLVDPTILNASSWGSTTQGTDDYQILREDSDITESYDETYLYWLEVRPRTSGSGAFDHVYAARLKFEELRLDNWNIG